ncbi:MAG: phosphatidylserine decarboxylase [Gammaproteobacteria bacterium]|nr:MAG: phosphatidylserine decarboxylase [Gammaproteobacteria bacterium]
MLAREATIPVGGAVVLAGAATYLGPATFAVLLWLIVLVLAFVYRDLPREIPSAPLAVVSPVDAEVISVREVHDPWLDREAVRIRLRPPILGIGPLRSPVEGKVMDYWTGTPSGHVDNADSDASPLCSTLWIQTDEGDDVVLSVRSNSRLSRFKVDAAPGERVGHGKRNGFVYLANRVDVLLPANAHSEIEPGARVIAGSGILGTLARASRGAA